MMILNLQNKVIFSFILFSILLRLVCLDLSNLLVEEAYYWNYANHLDFSYLDHPPMVALLIRAFTLSLGLSEWSVRLPSMLCWGIAAFFSYQLTELMRPKSGIYSVFLLSILPFFFVQSWVMTPDQPLLACWSACLYCLYRAMVLGEARYWLWTGVGLGLGLLSKYTIVLLGPCIFVYLLWVPAARVWFFRWQPYVAVMIATVFFIPVIYWNYQHEWISFAFQSSRRFHETYSFSTHQLIGLLLLFLMPLGVLGLKQLLQKHFSHHPLNSRAKIFIQIFTVLPLVFFGLYSTLHPVKFNWIGPGLLALMPWLSIQFQSYQKLWLYTAMVLLIGYTTMILGIGFGTPAIGHRIFLNKYISWENLTEQVYHIAKKIEIDADSMPVLIALDKYNIGSELWFYQSKWLEHKKINQAYAVQGSDLFGGESLMYRYWSKNKDLSGKIVLLFSDNPLHFNNPAIAEKTSQRSAINKLWSVSQGLGNPVRPYYYQIARMN